VGKALGWKRAKGESDGDIPHTVVGAVVGTGGKRTQEPFV
jgi:hypothetical protein